MKYSFQYLTLILAFGVMIASCKKDPETGCTDPLGDNYNAEASVDNNTCTFQKRFLGDYAGQFSCKGPFAAAFNMADLSITELIKKDEVNIIIQSAIGPLPVMGKLTKDTVTVDATLTNLSIKPSDILAGAGETPIKADGKVSTKLYISTDNKTLKGDLKITVTTKEPLVVAGLTIPAGFELKDDCGFVGLKK